jgi:hypothetical protein
MNVTILSNIKPVQLLIVYIETFEMNHELDSGKIDEHLQQFLEKAACT